MHQHWPPNTRVESEELVGTSVIPECAFVADADLGCWTDVAVADGTAAVVAFAKTAYGDACLAATHDEIGIVFGHGDNNTGVRGLRAELVKIFEFFGNFWEFQGWKGTLNIKIDRRVRKGHDARKSGGTD
jgi:hypothetical protein